MYWGYVCSKDLVYWEYLLVVLVLEGLEDKDGCFFGLVVVDGDILVLIYIGYKFYGDSGDEVNLYQVQCLVISCDGIYFECQGMVVDILLGMYYFCDLKVWCEGDCWYMIVGVCEGDIGQVWLYCLVDLCQWQDVGVLDEVESIMGYMWECLDFFIFNGKCVLMFFLQGMQVVGFSNCNLFQSGYLIGEWQSGQCFICYGEFWEMDNGYDFYVL